MSSARRQKVEQAIRALDDEEHIPLVLTMIISDDEPPQIVVAAREDVSPEKKARFVQAFQLAFEQAAAEVFGKEIGEHTTAYLGFHSIQRLASFVGTRDVRGVISLAVDRHGFVSSAVGGPLGADEVARAVASLHALTQANVASLPHPQSPGKDN